MAHMGSRITLQGLERAARCAGEAFGHDVVGSGEGPSQAGWRARLSAGLSAMVGRLVPGIR